MSLPAIVVLTGAGISAESGIRTFRATDGLWENHPVEAVATPEGYARDPARVQEFYNQRRQHLATVNPNAAHKALARFEKAYSGDFLLVTQNIDDLHDRCGSRRLLHMHGELYRARCQDSGETFVWQGALALDTRCPCCGKPGNLRPDVVWFGEMPLHMERISAALACCGLFVSIGTSGHVYPASGFFMEAHLAGARTVELNLEPGQNSAYFDERHYGEATEIVPKYFDTLLEQWQK